MIFDLLKKFKIIMDGMSAIKLEFESSRAL